MVWRLSSDKKTGGADFVFVGRNRIRMSPSEVQLRLSSLVTNLKKQRWDDLDLCRRGVVNIYGAKDEDGTARQKEKRKTTEKVYRHSEGRNREGWCEMEAGDLLWWLKRGPTERQKEEEIKNMFYTRLHVSAVKLAILMWNSLVTDSLLKGTPSGL